MTDYSASQVETPVNASAPNFGMDNADAIAERKRVSAESFRRLTSLLKKPAIPSLDVVATPQIIIPEFKVETVEPIVLAPQIEVVQPVAPLETEIAVVQADQLPAVEEPTAELVAVEQPIVELVVAEEPTAEIVPTVEATVEPTVELVAAAEPTIEVVTAEEPTIEVVAAEEPAIEVVAAQDAEIPELVAAEQIEISELPEVQTKAAAPEIKPTPRQKPRDAFALSPGAMPQKPPAPVIQQTPEQEQEASELARSLLDMMAAGNSAGLPQERALAADTLLRMLPRLPLKSTIMLSERVRLMDAPPPLLMAKLLADPNIAVSGPLLEDSNHIGDEDLNMVIQDNDFAKIRIIARRRKLSSAITSELIKTGDDSVLLTLVRNLGAEITQESFLALSEHAKHYPELLAPLCTRPDLPVPFAFELFWLAPVQLRRYLLNRFLTDSENLTKILKIARVTDGDEPTAPLALDIEKISGAFDLLSAGETEAAAFALSAMANINTETTERILADTQGEPMAALLKVIGVSRGDITEAFEILQTTSPALIDPTRNVEELQSTFDSLSFNKARILLTYWDWATLKTGPYAPLN
jgi:Uncharacterised protein conserved in bacteria (DUF2336)